MCEKSDDRTDDDPRDAVRTGACTSSSVGCRGRPGTRAPGQPSRRGGEPGDRRPDLVLRRTRPSRRPRRCPADRAAGSRSGRGARRWRGRRRSVPGRARTPGECRRRRVRLHVAPSGLRGDRPGLRRDHVEEEVQVLRRCSATSVSGRSGMEWKAKCQTYGLASAAAPPLPRPAGRTPSRAARHRPPRRRIPRIRSWIRSTLGGRHPHPPQTGGRTTVWPSTLSRSARDQACSPRRAGCRLDLACTSRHLLRNPAGPAPPSMQL